jgi:catechol 2,3-dioxygenase-like lactoylglutathione lyase family enzyme
MLTNHKIIAFAATSKAEAAKAFYEGVLGLTLTSDDPFALAFSAGGTMLRIQKVAAHTPLPYTTLGWETDAIAEAVSALAARGVRFERFEGMDQDSAGVWAAPGGAKVAWFRDPDGNLLSLSQHPR